MDNYQISIMGGTAFGILPNLPIEDIVVTVCMATFGTISSLIVTLLLKYIGRRWEKR